MVDERARREAEEGPGYETSRINLHIPLGTGLGAVIGIACALAIVWLFFHFVWKTSPGPKPYAFETSPPSTPAPRLLAKPKAELQAVRVRVEHRLQTYGWVDRKKQIVHIPISRAMQVIAKHGFPPRPPAPPFQKSGHANVPLKPTGEPNKPYPTGTANTGGGPP